MRLWSIHPKYLDAKGLVALWRETLLAQKVLQGRTKGYKNHPQLHRFKKQADPLAAISFYLKHIWKESQQRGYHFDQAKICKDPGDHPKIVVTAGQIQYEFTHLNKKLKTRDPAQYKCNQGVERVQLHPLFRRVVGDVEGWERVG